MSVQSQATPTYVVTRTDDSTSSPVPGMLRYYCEEVEEPRRVIFARALGQSPTITLTAAIVIESPWLQLHGGRITPIIQGGQIGVHASHVEISKLTVNGTTTDPTFNRRCIVIGRTDNDPIEDVCVRRCTLRAGRDDGLAMINNIRGIVIEKCTLSAIGTVTSNCANISPNIGVDPTFYPDTLRISDCVIDGDFRVPTLTGGLITVEGCDIYRAMRTMILHAGRYNIVNNRFYNRAQLGYWPFYDAGRIIAIYEDEFSGTDPASLIYLNGNTYDGTGYASLSSERQALCRKIRSGTENTDDIDTNAAYFSATRLTE